MIDHKSHVKPRARIYRGCRIFNSEIDSYTYVAPNSSVVHASIGKFCSISQNVFIGLPEHNLYSLSTSPLFQTKQNALEISWVKEENSFKEYERVIIGNDVWVGMNVLIKGGLTIGDGAVIGAGSIVTKDVPPYAVVVGSPAKIIKYRFTYEIIDKLINSKWWNFSEPFLKKNIQLFENAQFIENELFGEFHHSQNSYK